MMEPIPRSFSTNDSQDTFFITNTVQISATPMKIQNLPQKPRNAKIHIALNHTLSPYATRNKGILKSQKPELESALSNVDPCFAKDIEEFASSEQQKIKQCISMNELYISPIFINNKEHSTVENLRIEFSHTCLSYNKAKERVRLLKLKASYLKSKIMPLSHNVDYYKCLHEKENELAHIKVENDLQSVVNKSYFSLKNRVRASLWNLKKSISRVNQKIKNFNLAMIDQSEEHIKSKSEIRSDIQQIKCNQNLIPTLHQKFMSDIRQPLLNDYTNAIKYNTLKEHIIAHQKKEHMEEESDKHNQESLIQSKYRERISRLGTINISLEDECKVYENMFGPICQNAHAHGVKSIYELQHYYDSALKDKGAELELRIEELKKIIFEKEQESHDLIKKVHLEYLDTNNNYNTIHDTLQNLESSFRDKEKELCIISLKNYKNDKFMSEVITFSKRLGAHFRGTDDINFGNIVNFFYKYALSIQTYASFVSKQTSILPILSVNKDHSLHGQPLFLFPASSHLQISANTESTTKEKLECNSIEDNITIDYVNFKSSINLKSKIPRITIAQLPNVQPSIKDVMHLKLERMLRKNHIQPNEITKIPQSKITDKSLEKILRKIYCTSPNNS